MKKFIVIICTMMIILTLNSCVSKSNYDMNEFINALNSKGNYGLDIEKFTVSKEEYYIFTCLISKDLLLAVYADEKNEIVQCTVTTDTKAEENFYLLCIDIYSVLSKTNTNDSKKIIKKVITGSKTETDGWLITEIKSEIGTTFLINRVTNEKNTNNLPTLKEYINKEDISRPTADKNNENTTK